MQRETRNEGEWKVFEWKRDRRAGVQNVQTELRENDNARDWTRKNSEEQEEEQG